MSNLTTRSKKALAGATAIRVERDRPPFLSFATGEEYEAAVNRGEVPEGVKCYIGIDMDLL